MIDDAIAQNEIIFTNIIVVDDKIVSFSMIENEIVDDIKVMFRMFIDALEQINIIFLLCDEEWVKSLFDVFDGEFAFFNDIIIEINLCVIVFANVIKKFFEQLMFEFVIYV